MQRMPVKIFSVIPAAASFATPYSSGDVIGGLNTITGAVLDTGACAKLDSIVVLDAANQKSAIDLVFFGDVPASSFGADNAAYALADGDLLKLIGRYSVAGADYVSSSTTNAEATLRNIELDLQAVANSKNLYVVVVSRGTPTYGSATDLTIKLGMEQA